MESAFISGLTRMSFLSRNKGPKNPERVSSVEGLASAMQNPNTEAAVFESDEIASQEAFKPYLELTQKCLNDLLIKFFWNEDVAVSRIGTDESYFAEADRIFSQESTLYGLDTMQSDTARNFMREIIRDMLNTMRAFKNKKIVRYSTKFVTRDYVSSQESRGYHTDPSTGSNQNEMTVVRTLVGTSTILKHVPSQKVTTPRPGATVAFRLQKDGAPPLDFLHKTPPLTRGEYRFTLLFNVADLDVE